MRHDDDDNDDGESESNSSTDDAVENAKRDLQRHLLNDYVLVNISQFKKRAAYAYTYTMSITLVYLLC